MALMREMLDEMFARVCFLSTFLKLAAVLFSAHFAADEVVAAACWARRSFRQRCGGVDLASKRQNNRKSAARGEMRINHI